MSRLDLPKLPVPSQKKAEAVVEFDPAFFPMLKRFAAERKLELADILLAGFGVLLERYTRQNEFIIGSVKLFLESEKSFDELLKHLPAPDKSLEPQVHFSTTRKLPKGAELALSYALKEKTVEVALQSPPDRFSSEFLKNMALNFQEVLKGLVANPEDPVGSIPCINKTELAQIIKIGEGEKRPYPHDKSIPEVFEAIVEKFGSRTALSYEGKTITYLELNKQANQLARHLVHLGVKQGDFVGLSLTRSINLIVGLLAILKVGAAYLPIDATYPLERKLYMIEDGRVKLLLTQESEKHHFPAKGLQFLCLDSFDGLSKYPTDNLKTAIPPLALANVLYTSGSTGKPKGVLLNHRGVIRLVYNSNWFTIIPEDRVIQIANTSFDGMTQEVWGPLLNGAAVCIYGKKELSPEEMGKFLVKEKVTFGVFTARFFNLLVEHQMPALKNMRLMGAVGESMSVHHAKLAFEALPHCKIINGYGPTENSFLTTVYHITSLNEIDQTVPIGPPIANTQVYVFNPFHQLVPIGGLGELFTGGDGVADGYLRRPELTQEKFVSNPFGKGHLYRTGDLVRLLPSGSFDFFGRLDFQVKIRGFRIELGEIEETLRKYPKVGDCVVIAREDVPGEKKIVAYAEPASNETVSAEELKTYLASQLIDYMIPSFIIVMDELPVTPNGKIDRRALPAPHAKTEKKEALKTPTEQLLGDLWSQLLGFPMIGPDDNFFNLGGDSIHVMQVASRLKKLVKKEIPTTALFQHPVLKDFAHWIDHTAKEISPEEVIVKRQHHTPAPLSKNQESIWLANQLNQSLSAYFIDLAFSLEGDIDVSRLKTALETVIQRHESLRTTFTDMQHIHPKCPGAFHYEEMDRPKALVLLEKRSQPSFDLSKLPLFHFYLIKVENDQYVALLQVHHIIFDGWSAEVFFRDWEAFYREEQKEELPYQYADYALWQIEFLKTEPFKKQLQYWKEKLSGAPELLELPWDKPRPAVFSNKGDLHSFKLDAALSQKLKHLAKEMGITLFELLLAAFQVLLYRLSGKTDIVLGTPYANRSRNHMDQMIGYFVQMIITRIDFSDNPSFRDVVTRISRDLSESYQNADVPIDLIVATLNPQRNSSYSPLFQVSFTLEKAVKRTLDLTNVRTSMIDLPAHVSRFDLSMVMTETEKELQGVIEFSTDLFESSTMKRMTTNFQTLLEGICAKPQTKVAVLPLLNSIEKHQLLVEWNETKSDYPREMSIPSLFEKVCQKYISKVALTSETGDMTYGELNAKANQLAHHLKSLGIKKGDFVGVSVKRSLDLIVTVLGILKAGAACVPIDASYPLDRKLYMIEDTKLKFLLTEESEKKHFPHEKLHIICVDTEKFDKQSKENPKVECGPLDIANVLYTSGSTGKPKGVPLPHQGVLRLVCNNDRVPFSPEDRVLHMSNVSFDAMLFEVWGALLNGATLCIYPQKDFLPEDLGNFIASQKVTIALFPAVALNILVEQQLHRLKGLRYVYSGGEAMSAYHAKIAFEKLPDCCIGNAYGPTENTVITTVFFVNDSSEIENSVPIGRPIANTLVYILDSHQQPVPIGVHGELCTGGDGLTRGYLHRPDLTQEKFFTNPFGPGLLYRTGDLVRYREDGNIDYLGRIDNQVKIRGFRIEVGEIEEVLRQMTGIADCLVMSREDDPGNKRLVAYVESSLSSSTVREYAVSKLPSHMIPSFFIMLEKFPLTPNGKIDRKALPPPGSVAREEVTEVPRTPLEEIIADTWSVLLNIGKVGRKDSFFFIGGHSIAAARLASVLSKTLNITVPVGLVFEDSTLEKYAKRIENLMQPELAQKKLVTTSELFWIWRNKEARLDPEIGVKEGQTASEEQYKSPKKILLTGATGFVGAFMLKELLTDTSAQIYALLRADNDQEAMKRLQSTLGQFGLWDPALASRITPLCGDLEKPLLGLSEQQFETLSNEIDSIFHVGALVNHSLPYHKLKPANVSGTEEALRLACKGRVKPFHFVSTAAVFEMTGSGKIREDDDLNKARNLFNGYGQSKWVAEKLVLLARSRGLPANIYRLARVSGHSKTGACQTGDFLWRMAEASFFLKLAPDVGHQENITPVDFVCRALRAVSTSSSNINKQYHVLNPQLFAYRDIFKIFQQLGYPLQFVPYDQWRRTLVKTSMEAIGDRLQAIVPLFSEMDMSHADETVEFESTNLQHALKPMGISCPPCDEKLIKTYIDYFISIGFFPPK